MDHPAAAAAAARFESAEMYYRLLDCGVPVKHLVYNKVGEACIIIHLYTLFQQATLGLGSTKTASRTKAAREACNETHYTGRRQQQ
jgi:hypothetical protein